MTQRSSTLSLVLVDTPTSEQLMKIAAQRTECIVGIHQWDLHGGKSTGTAMKTLQLHLIGLIKIFTIHSNIQYPKKSVQAALMTSGIATCINKMRNNFLIITNAISSFYQKELIH